MKTIDFVPRGVCSRSIHIEVGEDGVIQDVRFSGGCSGNTQGVARLAVGRTVDEVIGTLSGIRCGMKGTSCPDQLAAALRQLKQEQ